MSRQRDTGVSVDGRQRSQANLIKGVSDDPSAAERQRANLKRGNEQHGAYGSARRQDLEQEHREQLRQAYPDAPDGWINAAATRSAMVTLLAAWIDDVGPIYRRGDAAEVSAPARELRLLLDAHERAIERLEVFQREASRKDPMDALREHLEASSAEREARSALPAGEPDADDNDASEERDG